ncbi:glycosyl hydrolase [Marivirga sp. S37H4]|uniref:Glycosyl hydrolase n=1 Tax=Marivirga aurantiaca TaxID=2802615 RepID=A0A934X2Z2_9BACT|nr:glycosyl hydrolase [Marivirga aurantiaca]MBK6267425.1 glycosyl hydrolase [Marivirga aurantiaca]
MKTALSPIILIVLLFCTHFNILSQVSPSQPGLIQEGIEAREKLAESSILKDYPSRNVGPVIQGARIVDIAVNQRNIQEFYVAYASGGLFVTKNNGVSFNPIFDNEGALTIGDIALAPSDENVLYVGTGENNSSRSSYAGSGIYKSSDKGETWEQIGLGGSQHIGRIVVHPNNPDIVWVASMGGLYSDNEERGVFKSVDGGKSWKKVLYVDNKTGAIDLIIHPENPDLLWASMWERKRYAWDFIGNGEGSGIYISKDGGENWELSMNGIPDNEFTGRIGLDVSLSNPNVVYALLDYQKETKKEKKRKDEEELISVDFVGMSAKTFLDLSDEKIDAFLKDNGFPEKFNAITVKKEIKEGKYKPSALAEYSGDANEALFETSVAGSIVYRSDDQGNTWTKTHDYDLEAVYYTYGYYFGEIRVSTQNPEDIYVLGVPLVVSRDAGKTFLRTDTIGNVHADHHAMWINPNDADHIILGNDGGLYISYDGGATWDHKNNMAVGQFYTVNVDMATPYNIYGGLQDNGTMVGSSKTVPNRHRQWESLFGGDGMYVSVDPKNTDRVYVGFQFGNYFRLNRADGSRKYITPKHDIGETPLRFNWRTPVVMSSHNADILYLGSHKLHRSLNKGDSWEAISPDLTNGIKEGNVPFGTITEITESPLKFGMVYVGTDDGNVWRIMEGQSWTKINKKLPQGLWVSSIHASNHDPGTVYLSLTGYRNDNFQNYIYKSTDYGDTWKSISGDLPQESVNVIYQDPEVSNLLYLGTDHGTYVSFNDGINWQHLGSIPNVANYDMIVHPRELELVIGTHGRSVYVVDAKPLQKIATEFESKNLIAFELDDLRFSESWGKKRTPYVSTYFPEFNMSFFIKELKKEGQVSISIQDESGKTIKNIQNNAKRGYQHINWNGLLSEDEFIGKGNYELVIEYNDETVKQPFKVK